MNVPHAYPRSIRRRVLATAVACCFSPLLALANPVGPVVTHGQASFNSQGKMLTVTNSPGSIINWRGFSIGAGETTRFVQQNAASAVLNRVVGGQSSSILGTLQSNGRVFLINPNGIIFGAGAQIDTAGLIASTLNIMDADFLTGKLRFGQTPDARSITNAGEIRTPAGGKVMLIAAEGVTNTGVINAPNGEVILAAGKTVELADSANPEVRVEVSAPDAKALNLGKIVAESGNVGIYGGLVVNRGSVNANSAAVGENGKIVFRASKDATLEAGSVTTANGPSGGSVAVSSVGTTLVAGDVQAKGSAGTGGEVKILGEQVGLIGTSSIDASGSAGGGTVLVGGDLQGANALVQNAKQTFVGADTRISADALAAGDGGKVIVWADETTRSYGSISARGGQTAGNGGFVETSGKGGLDVRRGPDVRAPAGRAGTWLLDPVDLEAVAGGELDTTINSGAPFFAPLTESSRIGVDVINAQLDFGSNVILTTTSRGTSAGAQQGNITISAPIVKSAESQEGGQFIGATSLTLQAHNNIIIGPAGSITSTGDPLSVVLTANSDNTGGGGVTVGGAITTRGGSFTATGADAIAINAPINTMNAANSSGSTVQLSSTAGAVTVSAPVNSGFFSASGQTATTISGPVAATSSVSLASNAGTTTIGSTITSTGSVTANGRTGVRVASGAQVTSGQFNSFNATVTDPVSASTFSVEAGSQISTGSVTLSSDNIDIQGSVVLNSGSATLRQNTSGRAINLGTEVGSALSLTQAELNNLSGLVNLNIGNSSSGAVTVAGPLSLTTTGSTNVQSGTSIVTNAGVTASGPLSLFAPTITVGAPMSAQTQLTLSADNLSVNSTASSSGNIDISPRTGGRTIALGVGTPTGNALELTASQINNLSSPGRVRFSTSGPISIAGAIAPTAFSTLSLASSNNAITEASGGTISVPNLALSARTGIDLQQDNNIGTVAAQLSCCSAGNISITNQPGASLAIGSVDGITGITVNNFSGSGNIQLQADDMNITAQVRPNTGDVKLVPRQTSTLVTLGADTPSTLGLTSSELGFVQGTKLTIAGDRMDISAPVTFMSANTTLAPITANRPVTIASTKSNPAELEFTPAELSNLVAGTVTVGGPNAGPISVNAPTTVPGAVSTFVLQSGDTASGITIAPGAGIAATNTVGLTTDTLTVGSNVSSTSGGIVISTNTGARNIDIGTDPGGSLGLDTTELSRLSAPAGSIHFATPSGDITVNNIVSFGPGSTSAVTMDAGSSIAVTTGSSLSSPGTVSLRAPTITLNGPVNAAAGDVTLVGNAMSINSGVTAAAGNIKVSPRDFMSIDLGGPDTPSNLGLVQTELVNLNPSGVLRIGDIDGYTGNINISTALTLPANRILSLKTASGNVTQAAPLVIPGGSLAVEASDLISLTQPNQVSNVALTSWYDDVSFVRAPGAALTLTQVDNIAATVAGYGNGALTITADRIDINTANPNVYLQGNTVTLAPPANGTIDIGTKPGVGFGLTQSEFDRIYANVLAIGNSNAGNITVTQPVASTTSSDLSLVTGVGRIITVDPGADLTASGNLALTGGTINTSAPLNSWYSGINLNANSIALGDTVTSGGGLIKIAPLTSGTMVAVGGADIVSTVSTLGLDTTDLGNLIYGGGTLTIGNATAGDMAVTYAGSLPGSVSLVTGGQATFSSSTFSASDKLDIMANSMSIPGVAGIAAANGIHIAPTTAGRSITLGSKPATGLELDTSELAKIVSTTGALSFDTSGTLTTTAPIAYTGSPDVVLSAGNLVHTGGLLSATGNIALRGDSITAAGFGGAQSTSGGRIVIAPRTFRSMAVGTQPGGSTLGLLPAQVAALDTTGVVQLGDTGTVSTLQITAPITQPVGSSALALLASSGMSQTSGSTITASNLRVQSSNSSVSLTDANAVGVLAGSSNSSFSFTTSGTLTVGSVDGAAGIVDSNVTLRADGLNINETIYGNTVTLAPRSAGGAVDLGSDSGFGLTNAEINRVSASTLLVGTSGTNPTSSITVSAPIEYTSGSTLNLQTGTGGTISVNAPLGSSITDAVGINAGAGGTANIAGPVTAQSSVSVTADTINVTQPVTAIGDYSQITLSNVGLTGSVNILAPVSAGYYGVSVSGKTIVVGAPVTGNYAYSYTDYYGNNYSYNYGTVTLSAPSGAIGSSVTVNQQVTAGDSISITTDSIAINAPLVTLNSSMSLQPRTSGTPINLGTETSGAFSLTAAELALLSVENLTIGSSSSGPLSITAPISSSTIQQLTLRSNNDITQTSTAPITLSYTDPDSGQPAAGLSVFASTGKVDLAADNNINNSVTGQAGGSTQNFIFKNLSPLKLQNVSTEIGFAPTGKTLFSSPPGKFVPSAAPTSLQQDLAIDAALAAILQAGDTQDNADKSADAKKEDDEKKDREERKKEGKKSCS